MSPDAAQLSLQAGDPQLPGVVTSVWRGPTGDVVHNFAIPVQSNMTSTDLAATTAQSLLTIPGVDPASTTVVGDRVHVQSTPVLDPLDGVLPGGSITWSLGTTAQASTTFSSPTADRATIAATGHFQPFFQPFQPAVFTAGVVTDVGELTAMVSAQELSFQTDGPIICQALFQRLAPRAPQYGAQINFAGDRLEVYFDPAYTVTQGGIIFGTTSPSPGMSGTINTPPFIPAMPSGDYNSNGTVDAADYVVWRNALGSTYSQLDYDAWRKGFGNVIGNSPRLMANQAIPEPAAAALAIVCVVQGCSLIRVRQCRRSRQPSETLARI